MFQMYQNAMVEAVENGVFCSWKREGRKVPNGTDENERRAMPQLPRVGPFAFAGQANPDRSNAGWAPRGPGASGEERMVKSMHFEKKAPQSNQPLKCHAPDGSLRGALKRPDVLPTSQEYLSHMV